MATRTCQIAPGYNRERRHLPSRSKDILGAHCLLCSLTSAWEHGSTEASSIACGFLPAALSTHPHHQRHPIPSHPIEYSHCIVVGFPLLPSHYTTLPAFPHPHSLRRCYRSHRLRTFASLPIALVGFVAFEAPQLPTCSASSRELLLPPPATACPGLPTANNTLSVASVHSQHRQQTHSHANKLIHAPLTKHTWTHTLTLAPSYQQPQAQFRSSRSLALAESHHASISPTRQLSSVSIQHTSSDLHEPSTSTP
jgi:hypothetical protein